MSRRWQSHHPYEPLDLDRVAASHYGERRRSPSADSTLVPPSPDPDVWQSALADAVLAVGGGLVVVASWTALRWALGTP